METSEMAARCEHVVELIMTGDVSDISARNMLVSRFTFGDIDQKTFDTLVHRATVYGQVHAAIQIIESSKPAANREALEDTMIRLERLIADPPVDVLFAQFEQAASEEAHNIFKGHFEAYMTDFRVIFEFLTKQSEKTAA